MSVRQILKSGSILCVVPDTRKAAAVKAALEGPISPQVPASILRTHPDVRLFLDRNSASLLSDDF
jgi:glucosamine-6-phosphate deaminase